MKSGITLAVLLTVIIINVHAQKEPKAIPGQFIVILKESSAKPVVKDQKKNDNREQKLVSNKAAREKNIAKLKSVAKGKNIKESSVVSEFADVLVGFSAKLTGAEKKALESDPDVEYIVQDYSVELESTKAEENPKENGAIFPQHDNKETRGGPLWNFIDNSFVKNVTTNFAQITPCSVTRAGGPVDGSTKLTWIWIVDTGIDLDHPDLNVMTNATYAKSFVAGETVDDGNGHGTHCAGVAAAKNNTFGTVGVSAGARVVPVKVLNNMGSGSFSTILAGINHIAMYDISGDVVNLPIGGGPMANCENNHPAIRDAIRNLGLAGTHVVISAGSDGNCNGVSSFFPGCINGTRVYSVGTLNCDLTRASYSNGGAGVDWLAVGTGTYSTFKNGGYITWSGTANASACVAGVIHARGGLAGPANGGDISFCGTIKPLAHL
ncbi:MAG: S8 family serine peptidase [Bacteroidota bacterium]|nr:S8 family serine peptidase [Bacteroidota bacterium]